MFTLELPLLGLMSSVTGVVMRLLTMQTAVVI